MIIHISNQRYEFIRSLGYKFDIQKSTQEEPSQSNEDYTTYHLLTEECGFCHDCQKWFWSVDANTPAELETIKTALGLRRSPEFIIEVLRNGRQATEQLMRQWREGR